MEQLENHIKIFKSSLEDFRQTIASGDSRLLSNDSDDRFSKQSAVNSNITPRYLKLEFDLAARIALLQTEIENLMRNDRNNL